MSWDTSNRRKQLPTNWNTLRNQTRDRAHGQCQATLNTGQRCTAQGTDCDHITPGNNHSLNNLQWLCPWHHKQKTAKEGNNTPRKPKPKPVRPTDTHPAFQ